MSPRPHPPAVSSGGLRALLVAGALLLTMPLVGMQGPLNTTPMDVLAVLFLGLYWRTVLVHRESMAFPLLVPVWLIALGSLGGLFAAVERDRALITLFREFYLYALFVTVAHFLARRCRTEQVVAVWTGITCTVVILTLADLHAGLLGGRLGVPERAIGTFENPNMFGNYLVVSFFLAWAGATARRPAFYLAMIVILVGIDATASNGALISTTCGCLVAMMTQPTRRMLPRLGAVMVAGGLALGALGLWHDRLVDHSLDLLSRDRGAVGGAALKGAGERFPLWLDAAESLRQTPWGVGPGNFNRQGGLVSGDYHGPHNDYLGMLTERGPIGLLGWLTLLCGVGVAVTRIRRAPSGHRPLRPEPLYGLLAALCVHATVIELSHFRHFWFALAVVFAAASAVRSTQPGALATPAPLREAA